MPLDLSNAPAVFQHMIKDIFREYLDDFVFIYLDNIKGFSKNEEEYEKHVQLVLKKLCRTWTLRQVREMFISPNRDEVVWICCDYKKLEE